MVVEQFAQYFTAVHMAKDELLLELGLDDNITGRSHDFSLSRRRGHTNRWPSRNEQSIIIADVGLLSKNDGRSRSAGRREVAPLPVPRCQPGGMRVIRGQCRQRGAGHN